MEVFLDCLNIMCSLEDRKVKLVTLIFEAGVLAWCIFNSVAGELTDN